MQHLATLSLVVGFVLSAVACQSQTPDAEAEKPAPRDSISAAPSKNAKTPAPAVKEAPTKEAAPAMTAELGKPAPDFELTGLDGNKVKLSDHKGKIVVLEWFNPDCPFVKASHTKGELKGMAATFKGTDVVWLAVNSGGPGRQGHGAETNTKGKAAYGLDHPILMDEDGTVGKMYKAKRTPHMYVIDAEGKLAYRGAIDNINSGDPEDVDKVQNYVKEAIDDLRAKKAVRTPETKAYGCSVKYKS